MSMNLAFETVSGKHFVDFPFQTPTSLSFAVKAAGTTKERLDLIRAQLKAWDWDAIQIQKAMTEVKIKLTDPTLRLIVI